MQLKTIFLYSQKISVVFLERDEAWINSIMNYNVLGFFNMTEKRVYILYIVGSEIESFFVITAAVTETP